MALNPGLCAELEARGLSNNALEQLVVSLTTEESGSIVWHFSGGYFMKFEVHRYGSMRGAQPVQPATKRARS